MSPPELGFLALGLALGTTAGAALMVAVRLRSPIDHTVRVTITPNAMPARAAGGPGPSATGRLAAPLPGSPDEAARMNLGRARSSGGVAVADAVALDPPVARTRVPSGGPDRSRATTGLAVPLADRAAAAELGHTAAPVPVAVAERPTGTSAPDRAVDPTLGPAAARTVTDRARPTPAPGWVGIPVVAGRAARSGGSRGPGRGSSPGGEAPAADPCADDRARTAAACAAAEGASDGARALADRLRDARRALDDLQARVDEASLLADGRRLAAEKERLHTQFKAVHRPTASADEAEAAAREWLTAVSAANSEALDAARRVAAATQELRDRAAELERLDLEASSARIRAERAEEACRTAREELAACEERQRRPPEPEPPRPVDEPWPADQEPAFDRRAGSAEDLDRLPVVVRVLRGDAAAREYLVAALADGDPAATATWHVRIADFVDAVTARAIEDGFLDLPEGAPFWRLFSGDERRDIVQALSALGVRFDGLGGFADDRSPSARDLSLAVGYAGLDPMRIRAWPDEAELRRLYQDATVQADLWLATQADDLALARVEASLGARAGGLSELWNAWGRIRPVMLEDR